MREVEQKDFTFSNDDYLSIFIGICKSQELLNHYMEQDYSLLNLDYIGSEFGIDFNINSYDEDFAVFIVNPIMSNNIDDVFKDSIVFDLDLLKKRLPK